jgi:hypothetical protein
MAARQLEHARLDEEHHHTHTLRRLRQLHVERPTCAAVDCQRRATVLRGTRVLCAVCAATTPMSKRQALVALWKRGA